MDDYKKILIKNTVEKYNLTEKEAKYLKKELKEIKIFDDDEILIRNSGEFNSKMGIIRQAVLVEGDRHICYL
jgi:hypothetical protein